MLQCCTLNNALIFKTCWCVAWSTDTEKKTAFGPQKLKCLRTCKMHLIEMFTWIMNICVWRSNVDRNIYLQVITAFWREQVTLNTCQKNHFRKGRTECKMSTVETGVPHFSENDLWCLQPLPAAHLPDVCWCSGTFNMFPPPSSLLLRHCSSTQICSLGILRLSSEVLVRSLMTSCISQVFTITITLKLLPRTTLLLQTQLQ